jgi:hypothetical protein
LQPSGVRVPMCLVSFIIFVVEVLVHVGYFFLGVYYLSCQVQHPVTGVTSAILESGEQCTVSSGRARRLLNYNHDHITNPSNITRISHSSIISNKSSCNSNSNSKTIVVNRNGSGSGSGNARLVSQEEAVLRTVKWGKGLSC